MKRSLVLSAVLSLTSLLLVVSLVRNAGAIPAFSRKYKTSCMTCHAPFPRLSGVGEAFRINGYKLPDDELYVKDQPVSMGAEAYKKMFPNAVWPSHIPGMPPISIAAEGDVGVDIGGTEESRVEFGLPEEVEILAAGAFDDKTSFFTEIEFENEGEGVETAITAWIMVEDLLANAIGANRMNIKAGSIGQQEIALPNTRDHNRITVNRYLYSTELNLVDQPGFEINGFDRAWRYHIGLVEGDDGNSEKDFYATLAYKFGGVGYDGSSGTTDDQEPISGSPEGYWRDDSVRLGFFAYRSYIGESADATDNIGADLRWNCRDSSLALGYIRGEDDSSNTDRDTWFAEAEYFLYPWMVPYFRYEALSVDGAADGDLARFLPGAAFLLRANVKATLEGRFYIENEPAEAGGGEKNDDDQLAFNISWAF